MSKKQGVLVVLVAGFMMLTMGLAPQAGSKPPPPQKKLAPKAPSSAAGYLGPEIQISTEGTGPKDDWSVPAIAYNSQRDEYLVVAHNNRANGKALYGGIVSGFGQAQSWSLIFGLDGQDSVQPAVVYNETADDYLLVWMHDVVGDEANYEIWGLLLDGNGTPLGSASTIISDTNRSYWTPRVAWNSVRNEYLVAWNAINTETDLHQDVSGCQLPTDGPFDSPCTPIVISDSHEPQQADVTYSAHADEYLVVWRYHYGDDDWDIYGARVNPATGEVVTPPGAFMINEALVDQQFPAVTASEQGHYLVLWQYGYLHSGVELDWDLHGQWLDQEGSLLGAEIILAETLDHETAPAVLTRPGPQDACLAVWQRTTSTETSSEEAIWAVLWDAGVVSPSAFEVAARASWKYTAPAVAADAPGNLIVYEGDAEEPATKRNIYGRRYVPSVVLLPLILRHYP